MVKQQTKTIWELRQEQIEHNIDFGYYVEKDKERSNCLKGGLKNKIWY